MRTPKRLVMGIALAIVFMGGYKLRTTFAKQGSTPQQTVQKLPPDIHPDTLSRAARSKREDFTTDEERKAFDEILTLSPKQKVSRWLGETGTRLQIPELAMNYQRNIRLLHAKGGLEAKYAELAILVGSREANDESAFVAHSVDAEKAGIDPKVVEIVRTEGTTKGLNAQEAVIIQFGRELFHQPIVSSKTFAEAQKQLGNRGTLGMTLLMSYYATSEAMLMQAYDQHLDTSSDCQPHNGCENPNGPLWHASNNAIAQQQSPAGQTNEKFPPDVHPETLARVPRPKGSDFTDPDERKVFERVMARSAKQSTSRWLGETGIRLQIPEIAEVYQNQIELLHEKSTLEPKYQQLTILVAAREADDPSAFLAHAPDAIKLSIDPKVVDIVRTRSETKGLDEKEATIIEFGRELFQKPIVSSRTFAAAQKNFGKKGTLGMTLYMCYYMANEMLLRAYDQRLDPSPSCMDPHNGCAAHNAALW